LQQCFALPRWQRRQPLAGCKQGDSVELRDAALLRLLLQELVEGYTPEGEIVDWVHLEQAVGRQVVG